MDHAKTHPNVLGVAAQWIKPLIPSQLLQETTFSADIIADCPGVATLFIAASNSFKITLNGVFLGQGTKPNEKIAINVNLVCGHNKLAVAVVNLAGGLASAIFAVVQTDQSKCYKCDSTVGYYDRYSCQCRCYARCSLHNKLSPKKIWANYPTCKCQCANQEVEQAKCNPLTHYFSVWKCGCKCLRKSCATGHRQNRHTCQC